MCCCLLEKNSKDSISVPTLERPGGCQTTDSPEGRVATQLQELGFTHKALMQKSINTYAEEIPVASITTGLVNQA